jgi:hypothetical protein
MSFRLARKGCGINNRSPMMGSNSDSTDLDTSVRLPLQQTHKLRNASIMAMIQISNLNTAETESFLTELQATDSTEIIGGSGGKKYGGYCGNGGGYGGHGGGYGGHGGGGYGGHGRGEGGEGRGEGGRGGYGGGSCYTAD